MDKQNAVYTFDRTPLGDKKGQTPGTCCSTDKPQSLLPEGKHIRKTFQGLISSLKKPN